MIKRDVAFTAYYDNETGEMSKVEFSPPFMAESVLMRADVLKDIHHFIQAQYARTRDAAFKVKARNQR